MPLAATAFIGASLVAGTTAAYAAPVPAGIELRATVAPSAPAGADTPITVSVKSAGAGQALVDIEVYDASNKKVMQKFFDNENFAAGQSRDFTAQFKPGAAGTYTVKVGIFEPGWANLIVWNDGIAQLTVSASAPATAYTPATSAPSASVAAPAAAASGSTRGTGANGIEWGIPAAYAPAPQTPGPESVRIVPPAAGATTPAAWDTLEIGMNDGPGGAGDLKAAGNYGFRYQYLAGGVNTGSGWATWNDDGGFVSNYIEESAAVGITPVFTYYQIFQSSPGRDQGESSGIATNLGNGSTMNAYWNDMKLFFQRAGEFPGTQVIFHVEPDLWGYTQKQGGDNASAVTARVGSAGVPEIAGQPDNMVGFASAIRLLRDRYAPNVQLAYQLSVWGTGNDIALSNPSDAEVDRLAGRAAGYFNSLQGGFDLVFSEFSDRDAGFKADQYGDGGASWWDDGDFRRNIRFLSGFSSQTQKRLVMWQIPFGNTKVAELDNSWNAYQDNRVEWLLDDPSGEHLAAYVNAGVVALLFGRGADGATCACDANDDGRDDDGGYFKERVRAYYAAGPVRLP